MLRIARPKNTKKGGVVEFFVYPEKDKYVGVCLTFDIVEEGKDPSELMESLKEAAILHIKVVTKKDLSDELLNRYAPAEYWSKYFDYLEMLSKHELKKKIADSSTQKMSYSPQAIFVGATA